MQAENAMEFSIIIPTYNRADELRETIRSIAKLNVTGPRYAGTSTLLTVLTV